MKSKKSPLVKTTEDFAGRTTVHGIGYVFDPSLNFIDRTLWLAVKILTIIKLKVLKSYSGGFNVFGASWLSDQSESEGVEGRAGRYKKSGFSSFSFLGNFFSLLGKIFWLS